MRLDISEILLDPDVAGTRFSVIRRTEVVSEVDGRATYVETPTNDIVGSVVPGDSGKLLRKEDGQMTDNVITVTTRFRLRAASEGIAPDIILFDGIRYTVTALKRWGQAGTGFVRAACVSQNAFDKPL